MLATAESIAPRVPSNCPKTFFVAFMEERRPDRYARSDGAGLSMPPRPPEPQPMSSSVCRQSHAIARTLAKDAMISFVCPPWR